MTTRKQDGHKLTKAFTDHAIKVDEQIKEEIKIIGTSWTRLGKLFHEVKTKGLHLAVGFKSFEEYIKSRYPEKKKTQIYEAVRIVRELTGGVNAPLKPEDLNGMTAEAGKKLVDLKKKNGSSAITPAIVDQAKTLTADRFQEKLNEASPEMAQEHAVSEGRTIAGGAAITVNLQYFHVQAETAALMNRAAEIARYVNRDASEGLPDQDRFLQSLAQEYIATYEREYEEAKQNEEAEGVFNAQRTDAEMGPDEAETEQPEARHVEVDEDSIDIDDEENFGSKDEEDLDSLEDEDDE